MNSIKKKGSNTEDLADFLLDDEKADADSTLVLGTRKTKLAEKPVTESLGPEASTPPEPTESEPSESGIEIVAEQRDDRSPLSTSAGTTPGFKASSSTVGRAQTSKLAQERILDLEREIDRLRIDNEKLISVSEALKNRTEELSQKAIEWERKYRSQQESFGEEKRVLQEALGIREQELMKTRNKTGELEDRLAGDLKKIRVRERELENRLELIKVENGALARSKNEMILELKRQMDQLTQEVDSHKQRRQALARQLEENQDRVLRAVKAMRLALTVLDGEDGNWNLKKAE